MLRKDELLELEGKLVHVAFLGGDGRGPAVEPYIIFGPQRRLYGLEQCPDLAEYNRGWVAFDDEPSREQVEVARRLGSNDRSMGSPPWKTL